LTAPIPLIHSPVLKNEFNHKKKKEIVGKERSERKKLWKEKLCFFESRSF